MRAPRNAEDPQVTSIPTGTGAATVLRDERFSIRRCIGEGGSGKVYEAWDHARAARVALKTLHGLGPSSLLQLKREFRASFDLAHPNLTTLHDLFVSSTGDGDECFFTMELVDGVDVVQWIRRSATRDHDDEQSRRRSRSARTPGETPPGRWMDLETVGTIDPSVLLAEVLPEATQVASRRETTPQLEGAFDEGRLRSALAQLVEGVRALHAAGLIHRDLKPSNVLVREDGRLSILDYGLVTSRETLQAEVRGFHGTPAYAAPEQALGGDVGPAADWYAVGVILFEAITGSRPFEGSSTQILVDKMQREAPRVDEDVEGVPKDLVELCARLLARAPEKRSPASAEDEAASAPFVGREAELAILERAFVEASRGEARVVAIAGPSGIGKSTLVRTFLARSGARVLASRCNPREVIPYNAFDSLVDALARVLSDEHARPTLVEPRDAPALIRVFPVLGSVFADVTPSDDAPDAVRQRAFGAVRDLFASIAPAVVWIDDFQWADRDSLALLAEVLRVRDALPVLFVLTQRDDHEPAMPWAARRISLPPLGERDARELLRSMTVDDARADEIVRVAHGHPLFLQHIALYGRDGRDVDAVLQSRVAALPPSSRRVVELLSIAVSPLEEGVLADAIGEPREEIARALVSLRADRLVRVADGGRGHEPFHDRVREAIALSLDDETRSAHHGRLAQHLSADPHALAHHLAAAGRRAEAARVAVEAARRAEKALAFERAALLWNDAIALGLADTEARDARMRLAEALANAHRGAEAAEAWLAVAHESTDTVRSRALRRAAELFLMSGELTRGMSLLRDVLAEADEAMPKTTVRALAVLLAERARLATRGLGLSSRTAVPAREIERADLLRGVSQGLGMADNFRAAMYDTRSLRAALDIGDPPRAASALAIAAIFRGSESASGRRRSAELLARAVALAGNDPEALAWIEGAGAAVAAFALESPDIVLRLSRAETFFRDRTTGNTWPVDSLRLIRAHTSKIYGDLNAIRATLPEDLRDARRRGDRYLETSLTRGTAFLWLCDDEPERAREALASATWSRPEDGFHLQHWLELEARADIDLYLGRTDTLGERAREFRMLTTSFLTRIQRLRVHARSLRGRLLLARAAVSPERRAALTVARLEISALASLLDREDVPDAWVHASLLRAGIASLERRGGVAVRELRRAVAIGEPRGLALTTAAARLRLGDPGGEAWLRAQGVRRPDRFVDVAIPGAWPLRS